MHHRPSLILLVICVLLAGCHMDDTALPDGFDRDGSVEHFAIELDGVTAGAIEQRRGLTAAGAPRMDVQIRMHLPGTGLMLREERLQFAGEPPHPLLKRTRFTRTPTGIEHHETASGEALGSPTVIDFDGALSLASAPAGSRLTLNGLFGANEGTRMRTTWEIETRTADGTRARGQRGDGAEVRLELGPDGRPERYEIGSGFALQRVARPPQLDARESTPLLVAVEQGLGEATTIDGLTVRVEGPAAVMFQPGPGLAIEDEGDARLLLSTRLNAAVAQDSPEWRELDRLVGEVRRRIRYHAGAAAPSLDALLRDGRGDCYEFASLYAALATAAGYETRVVTGLAWAGDELGGFAPHAWNEVRLDGGWITVDPTWDRVGADAARLRFPDDPALQLDLQLALERSNLEIVAATPAR